MDNIVEPNEAPYTLEGREAITLDTQGADLIGSCVICGSLVAHIEASIHIGRRGWVFEMRKKPGDKNEESKVYLYCNSKECVPKGFCSPIFRCGCMGGTVESVGAACTHCGAMRGELTPWDEMITCLACDETVQDTEENIQRHLTSTLHISNVVRIRNRLLIQKAFDTST